tara:strand:- start:897 stop:1655 length:759 start_codon:yes stop_codon:yes gene_type:complete
MVNKTILVTQARMGSTRFPEKILKEVNGIPLLKIHLDRIKKCKNISDIIIATTLNDKDEIIYKKSIEWGFHSFRGSETNVLDRYYNSLKDKNVEWVVRVTSDCPLIDPELIDSIVEYTQKNQYDYVSNCLVENYPDGQDIEVFKFNVLKTAWKNAKLNSELEHVTPYIRNNAIGLGKSLFRIKNYECDKNYSMIRMTVDEPEDFKLIKFLIEKLGTKKTWLDYTEYIIRNNLSFINEKITRNEGYLKSLNKD